MSTLTAKPITERQQEFILTLERTRVLTDEDREMIAHTETAAEASFTIGRLMQRPGIPAVHEDGNAISEGYFLQTDSVYRVVRGKTGNRNLYAKKLITTSFGRARWEYAPGAIRHLIHADRLTLEDAKAMGTRYGVCVVCGRTLTDPDSVEAGIGPVCSARL